MFEHLVHGSLKMYWSFKSRCTGVNLTGGTGLHLQPLCTTFLSGVCGTYTGETKRKISIRFEYVH